MKNMYAMFVAGSMTRRRVIQNMALPPARSLRTCLPILSALCAAFARSPFPK